MRRVSPLPAVARLQMSLPMLIFTSHESKDTFKDPESKKYTGATPVPAPPVALGYECLIV